MKQLQYAEIVDGRIVALIVAKERFSVEGKQYVPDPNNEAVIGLKWDEQNGFEKIADIPNPAAEQAFFEKSKADKNAEINAAYEARAAAVKVDTPESEVQTWYIQELEATAWDADHTAPTPFIDGLAVARHVDRSELIGKVLAKVTAFKAYMAHLTGKRQAYEDRIKAATTLAEIDNTKWED